MSVRHWLWILAGLTLWTAIVVLWATTPPICTRPEAAHSPHCEHR